MMREKNCVEVLTSSQASKQHVDNRDTIISKNQDSYVRQVLASSRGPASIVSLQSGQEQFTNRLLQQIESNTTTNFVLSPHSIHSVFSQLLQGSGGRTKTELENLLGVTASDSLVEQYRILGQGLSSKGFKQANLIALDNSFKPKHAYQRTMGNGFQSNIREFDFSSKPQESVRKV